ncbi:hypothetical protein [Gloeocapsa sp. PCC 73106]|uniref:hypothetical protein n=1 Tax=Gloeocapsa sp. PCC 73106 TaxID=102232 RepID=UPI0002F82EB0|nr:hypothetical protein [Gloeocapsa sp. PCC 73106]
MSQSSTDQPNLQPEEIRQKDYTLTIFFICASIVMLVAGGVGFFATSRLLNLPKAESCPKVFWPLASASVRLYCAQLATQKHTVSGWVEAINMVEVLPEDHPMRSEVERNVKAWVREILDQGETLFQSGKIDQALELVNQVPNQILAYELVKEQKAVWQSIWQEAESKEKQIEHYIDTRNWSQAFREAAQLTSVQNQYWSTVKYEESLNQIQLARSESSKLESAYALVETGDVESLLEAMAEAKKINPTSSAYQEAKQLIDLANNNLLKMIQTKVESRDWEGLQELLSKIPEEVELSENIEDWRQLVAAGTMADEGTVAGIEEAIALAEVIESKSPVYYEAQKLINRWELESENVETLGEARKIAQKGSIEDLSKAIEEAKLISAFHPRYQEAQTEISQWNRQIQIIEDQPILEQAEKLSRGVTVNAWLEAITQASLIRANRPLYPRAQNLILENHNKIETTQDQPILTQAIRLAEQENWTGAIAKAQEIPSGRALSQQAQEKISLWQQQLNAQDNLLEANRLAASNRVSDLNKAIQLASQIPSYTSVAAASQESIEAWSNQLLTKAQETADYDLTEAINIASLIPRGTSAYNSARTYVEIWRKKQSQSPLSFPEYQEN